MFIAAILSIAGFGFVCWLVFNLAVYALSFFAGLTAGLALYHHGARLLGAIAIGLFTGASTLLLGQFLFARFRSPILRAGIAIAFAIPAAIAGFHLMHGLSGIRNDRTVAAGFQLCGRTRRWHYHLGAYGSIPPG